jgi:dTDP-4-amino-4,6-dideoxygalactose transaminase
LSGTLSLLARSVDFARSPAGLIGARRAHGRADSVSLSWLDHRDSALLTELLEAVESLARRGSFTLGEEVKAFEEEFAAYCGTRHYPVPIHLAPAFSSRGGRPVSLPCAERLAGAVCSLPVHPGLDGGDVARVASAVREFTSSCGAGGVRGGV